MKKEIREILVAVAGQPNSGKSTIFNLLTGARQHVANYPGITVEKKTGAYYFKGDKIIVVDLPGNYSLTSYTLEERIARDFVLHEKPDMVVDIIDASNLERNLYLTFQLAEMGLPLILNLNMMDVVKRRGFEIDLEELSRQIGAPVVPTVGSRGKGKNELRQTIYEVYRNKEKRSPIRLDYGERLEPALSRLERELSKDARLTERYLGRWLTVKLMENDSEAQRIVKKHSRNADILLNMVAGERKDFISQHKITPEKLIAQRRYETAGEIVRRCLRRIREARRTLTDRVDQIFCNRFAGPVILLGTIYALYNLSIVQGYRITNYTWPVLAAFQRLVAAILPSEGFIFDPLWRAMPLGVIGAIVAVLNYVPIFIILFILISIMEDSGYMARMAFILDRVFRYFGLHGQSVLPLVLGGVFVGGCAIPGVMACRGIKDEKARLATIMVVPLMNCLAKIPLYVLLVGLFFAAHKSLIMFFIATITIIIALGVAKVLSLTVLRRKESAPFIMEMPPYHLPTISGVLRRALERIWLFVRKIITVVFVVMILIYFLINFPGLSKERRAHYDSQAEKATQTFFKKIGSDNRYANILAGDKLMEFARYLTDYKKVKMGAKGQRQERVIDQKFKKRNFEFFKVVKKGKYKLEGKKIKDKEAKKVFSAYKKLNRKRTELRAEIKEETIRGSFMGRVGRSIEPLTKWAGFNWKVNIALLSSFAAKENSVATLGVIYQSPMGGEGKMLEERMGEKERGWTPLHALAIILFFTMYPPCIPTLLMIKLEAGTKWMLFAAIYPIILGFIIAVLVFTVGGLLGLSGLQAMIAIYLLAIALTTGMGLVKANEATA